MVCIKTVYGLILSYIYPNLSTNKYNTNKCLCVAGSNTTNKEYIENVC